MSPDYSGYERLDSFTPQQLEAYRRMLLEKTKPQVEFIRRHVTWKYDAPSVFEIGCGNGRLLIGLEQAGLLRFGYGVDSSESRIQFGNRWLHDLGSAYEAISLWPANILEYVLEYEGDVDGYDLAVCITGCFQYFYPISPEAPAKVLKFMRGARYALFELYRKPPMGRTWHKLPEADPWEYLLDEYEDVGDWVRHTKTFLGRDGKKDTRVENLAYYEMPVFLGHLRRAGFNNVHWATQNSTTMVVLVS